MARILNLWLLATAAWLPSASAFAQLDLTGTITSEAGEPLTGATVWIYTAGPRVGIGFL